MDIPRKKERKHSPQGRDIPRKKERKKADNAREGWEDGTPPPHRDFKERSGVLAVAQTLTLGRLKKERKKLGRDGRTACHHHTGILKESLKLGFARKILFPFINAT